MLLRPCTLFVWQTSQNRFGFFTRLVSFFWFWHRQYNLPWPYRIYCLEYLGYINLAWGSKPAHIIWQELPIVVRKFRGINKSIKIWYKYTKKYSEPVLHSFDQFYWNLNTVKLGDKERFDNEQIGVKEPFTVTNLPIYFIRKRYIWG